MLVVVHVTSILMVKHNQAILVLVVRVRYAMATALSVRLSVDLSVSQSTLKRFKISKRILLFAPYDRAMFRVS